MRCPACDALLERSDGAFRCRTCGAAYASMSDILEARKSRHSDVRDKLSAFRTRVEKFQKAIGVLQSASSSFRDIADGLDGTVSEIQSNKSSREIYENVGGKLGGVVDSAKRSLKDIIAFASHLRGKGDADEGKEKPEKENKA